MKHSILKTCALAAICVGMVGCGKDSSIGSVAEQGQSPAAAQGHNLVIDANALLQASDSVMEYPELAGLTDDELARLGWRKVPAEGVEAAVAVKSGQQGSASIYGPDKEVLNDPAQMQSLGMTSGLLFSSLNRNGVRPDGILISGGLEYGGVNWGMYNYYSNDRAYAKSLQPVFKSKTNVKTVNDTPRGLITYNLRTTQATGRNTVSYDESYGYTFTTTHSHNFKVGIKFKFKAAPFGVGGEAEISAEYSYTYSLSNGRQESFKYGRSSSDDYTIPSHYKQVTLIRATTRTYTETYDLPLTVEGSLAANYPKKVDGHYFWSYDIRKPFRQANGGQEIVYEPVEITYDVRSAEVFVYDPEPMTPSEIETGKRMGKYNMTYWIDF